MSIDVYTRREKQFNNLMDLGLYETAIMQVYDEGYFYNIFLTVEKWEILYDNNIIKRSSK